MFTDEIEKILQAKASRFRSVNQLLDAWNKFVEQCAQGYEMNIYEYDNDLSVRNLIQELLNSNQLLKFPEYISFSENINVIDAKFKNLLAPNRVRDDKATWWQRGILKSAGNEYMRDISSMYPTN